MCNHPNMQSTARVDYCPDCKYEFYYGDAHATGEAQLSKLINPGRDKQSAPSMSQVMNLNHWKYEDDIRSEYDDEW